MGGGGKRGREGKPREILPEGLGISLHLFPVGNGICDGTTLNNSIKKIDENKNQKNEKRKGMRK